MSTSAFSRVRDALGDRVERSSDSEITARCPSHEDGTASLTVTAAAGKALVNCHAGCTPEAIVHALRLRMADLFDRDATAVSHAPKKRIVATYDYVDEVGTLLFQKVRYEPKTFSIRRPDGNGGWVWDRKGVSTVLYGLPALRAAIVSGETVCVVEGEKDVRTLAGLGVVATCNADGAAKDSQKPKWTRRDRDFLAGAKDVVIIPDKDDAGRAHAAAVVSSLRTLHPAPLVRMLHLPDAAEKGDVTDWAATGKTREEFLTLLQSAPEANAPSVTTTKDVQHDDGEPDLPVNVSEDELALEFTARNAGALAHCATLGGWQVFDGISWRKDEKREPYAQARALVRDVASRMALDPKQYMRVRSASAVNAIVSLASSDRAHAVTQEQFDADPWLLNTPAGAVDLRTGQLRPNRADDYCTRVTSVAPGGDCPRWWKFLDEVTAGDVELIEYLQRLSGYWLTGITREHALVFVYGTGGNGKSVFLNTVLGLVGSYGQQAPMSLFEAKTHDGHPTELAMLRGARLVVATETEEGRAVAESRIKVMTGGDPITARFMHRDFFTYTPQFKPVIAGNHRPRFKNPDEAIRRRLHLVPFTQTFATPDLELAAKLQAEAGGILAWAIEGCQCWQNVGLQPPAIVRLATSEYLEAEDSVGAWLDECVERTAGAFTSSAALWESWQHWATARGEYVGNTKRLRDKLESRGFESARNSAGTQRGFRGIAVQRGDTPGLGFPRAA